MKELVKTWQEHYVYIEPVEKNVKLKANSGFCFNKAETQPLAKDMLNDVSFWNENFNGMVNAYYIGYIKYNSYKHKNGSKTVEEEKYMLDKPKVIMNKNIKELK